MSVRTLSNHYETLRVAATATTAEIAEAFSSQMRQVRVRPDMTVARIAQLSLAYETLRDPARRSAYDNSIGLKPEPPAPKAVSAAPFVVGSYGPARIRQTPSSVAPKAEPARPGALSEPRVAAFIAASLRERAPQPEPEARPQPAPARAPAAELPLPAASETAAAAAPVLIDRNRANIAAGLVGLGVLAIAVSLPKANSVRLTAPVASAQAVTVGLPPATPVQDYVVPPPATTVAERHDIAPVEAKAEPAPTPEATQDTAREAVAAPPAEITTAEAAPQSPPVETTSEVPAPTPVAEVAEAKMPLPNATVARTIERIGYSCGSVSSVVADSGPGVFKVTCSSGDSYRAAPIGGRYHFRRLGRQ